MRFKEDAFIFYKQDKQIPSEYHNRPLSLTASLHDVELTRGLVDAGSSLNIMPLLILEEAGTREYVVEQAIEVSGFGGNALFTLGYVIVDL